MENINLNHQVIGIVGLAKNTGKTTTFNYLTSILKDQHKIGITSIGLDGEDFDQITFLPKPKIYVYKHMVVATAKSLLKGVKFVYRVLEETQLATALGPVVIIEMVTEGYVVLAGPATNKDLNTLVLKIKKFSEKILIDGALNRMTFASIKTMDAIILATGASLFQYMEKTIEKTKQIIDSFMLPKLPSMIFDNCHMAIKSNNDIRCYKTKDLSVLLKKQGHIQAIELKGALTTKMVDFFIENKIRNTNLIIEDATKLLLSTTSYAHLKTLKIRLFVCHQVKLLAITINPFSPAGHHYDKEDFLAKMKLSTTLPVFNIKEMRDAYVKT